MRREENGIFAFYHEEGINSTSSDSRSAAVRVSGAHESRKRRVAGGRRECEGAEDVIRSADGGMSHFCGVICLNGEKHLSPRGEAGPQGTHACSILWKQEGKKTTTSGLHQVCSVITFANSIWFNVRNCNHLHVQLPMALRSFIVKVSSMFDCLGSVSRNFRPKLASMFRFF